MPEVVSNTKSMFKGTAGGNRNGGGGNGSDEDGRFFERKREAQ